MGPAPAGPVPPGSPGRPTPAAAPDRRPCRVPAQPQRRPARRLAHPIADYSRLGRLLQRQLALGCALPIAELQTGVRRATGTAPPVAALHAWLSQHSGLEVHRGQARAGAAPASGWSTREDRLLLSCFGDRQHATRRELVATGLAAGRTQGAISVALARSPILRRDQRGVYRLPRAAPSRP